MQNDEDDEKDRLEDVKVNRDHLIDINKYRWKGRSSINHNFLYSTCPTIPRFHATFGQSVDRQEISKEMEQGQKNEDQRRIESKKFLGRIDKIYKHEKTDLNLVKDDFGIHVFYDATFLDMRSMEQELLKICSFYINKAEPLLDSDLRNTYPAVDRVRILDEVLHYENLYQENKLDLVNAYLECYEHTSDLLEQHRLIQAIVDEMARRPKLNLSGSHFKDSYEAEIQCMKEKVTLIRGVMKMLMKDELDVNVNTRQYLEKSYRLLHEMMNKKFTVVDPEK